MNELNSISNLKEGERFFWPESDYGRAEVYYINNVYILFEIPMYGGIPRFSGVVKTAKEAFDIIESWT